MSRFHRQTHNRAWGRLRKLVLERDGHRCKDCGKAGRLECHHVLELHRDGSNDLGNLRTLCRGCHIQTHARKVSQEESAWQRMGGELTV